MARVSLASWIQHAITDKDKDGPCTAISLLHQRGDGKEKEVHSTKLPVQGANISASDLASMFNNMAEAYAQDLPGVQMFVLACFYGSTEPQAHHPFSVKGKVDYDGATEESTEKGQRQQSMRHLEASFAQNYRRASQLDEYAMRIIERQERIIHVQAGHIEKLQSDNLEAFDVVKEMMQEKIKLDHDSEMAKAKFIRETKEREKWLSFAPMLINTILGRDVFPSDSADKALIDSIADNLSPDDIQKLAMSNIIKPELIGPLAARFEKRANERALQQKHEAELALPPRAVTDPEAEAAGEVQPQP